MECEQHCCAEQIKKIEGDLVEFKTVMHIVFLMLKKNRQNDYIFCKCQVEQSSCAYPFS